LSLKHKNSFVSANNRLQKDFAWTCWMQ